MYLVRHGSTGANEGGKRQSPETALDKNGEIQAQKTANWLSDKKIELILSSPWARAKQTAETIGQKLDLPITFLKILQEKAHNPDLYGASFEDEIHRQYVRESEKDRDNIDWKLRGKGESVREMLTRGVEFEAMLGERYREKTLVVVSHAYFIKGLVAICLEGKNFDTKEFRERYKTTPVDNGSISLLENEREGSNWAAVFLNLL